MKIGIYDPYLDTLGGGERYMLSAAKCLSSQHEVSVFWDPSDKKNISTRSQEKFGLNLQKIVFTTNIFNRNTPLISRVFFAKKYDRIIFLSDGSLPFALSRNLIVHFQFPVQWVDGNAFKMRIKLFQAKAVICNSVFTKSYIDRKFNVTSTVLYPPVDGIDRKEEKKENVVLSVGRFGNYTQGSSFKKQEVLVGMFKRILQMSIRGWRLKLVVSTRSEDRKKLQDLKHETSGFPIDFLENPDFETLAALYRQAKIYWHAGGFGEDLEQFPERAEHFGIATVEAMSAGAVPVVVAAGGQKEIVVDGQSGFLWSSLEECIVKTLSLIKSEEQLQTYSRKASERSLLFSKEAFCKKLYEIIQ